MTIQHFNSPANIAHAESVIEQLEKRDITLEVIVNHWGLKQVIIHQKGGQTHIANRASFNSFWSDADVITDIDTLSYVEDNFGIDLSNDALNAEHAPTVKKNIIDKYISLLKADKRVNELHIKNVISALYLNDSIKEDEKQLRKLIHSDKNFNGCNVTTMLINDLIATIKDNKIDLFALPDNVPVICKQLLNVNIETEQKQSYDIMLHAYN